LQPAKLADRRITSIEVEQVIANGPYAGDNPAPRASGSKIVIGPPTPCAS
jgi:hypothetical protein